MFCTQCGKYIEEEDASFCTQCGNIITSHVISESDPSDSVYSDRNIEEQPRIDDEHPGIEKNNTSFDVTNGGPYFDSYTYSADSTIVQPPSKRSKTKPIAIVAVVLLITCALAVMMIPGTENNDYSSDSGSYNPDNSSTLYSNNGDDQSRFILMGAYYNNIFTASYEDGRLVTTINSDYLSDYGKFDWVIYYNDGSDSKYGSISKEQGFCTAPIKYGSYIVKVLCYGGSSDSVTYTGYVDYTYTVTTNYSWTYDNEKYNFKLSYDFLEYNAYNGSYNTDNPRSSTSLTYTMVGQNIAKYVIVNDVIQNLANSLKTMYLDTYGIEKSINGQNFADFILAFVQIEFGYMYDSMQYKQDEYYAYPMETIYSGNGDCEDTSILCAALYEALGYDAAVLILPGHCMVGIALDSCTTSETYLYTILSDTYNGVTYYAGETTADSFLGIGLASSTMNNGGSFNNCLTSENKNRYGYGFYPII